MASMFSLRSAADREPNALAQAVERARASGSPLIDLTASNPTKCGLHYASAAIREALSTPEVLRYGADPLGLAGTRSAIAGLWSKRGYAVKPSQLLLTASTSEAYGLLFKLLCDPGDEVLAPQPSYPLFDLLARFEGVRLVPYPLRYDGAWHIDIAALRHALTPRTRAVLVVTPNNPTGSYLKRGELDELAALQVPIISDEVFAAYPLRADAQRVRSVLETETAPLVFALDGLSKLVGLPQLKLAWITASGRASCVEEAMKRLELVADTYLSVATPVQLAAARLLELGESTRASIHARVTANLASLRHVFTASPITVLDVEGGWYAVLQLPAVLGEDQWVLALVEAGVLVQPGWFYDFLSEPYLVVSLLTPEHHLREGAHRIATLVMQHC